MTKLTYGFYSALLAAFLATGCASVPMASMDKDTQAKQFHVPPDMSRIYVYRNESMGGAIKIVITLDGKVIGSNAPKTFFALDVTPGKHDVGCLAENTTTLPVNANAGKPVFVWQEVKMGMWSPRCALNQVDDQIGSKGVLESGLAQPNP